MATHDGARTYGGEGYDVQNASHVWLYDSAYAWAANHWGLLDYDPALDALSHAFAHRYCTEYTAMFEAHDSTIPGYPACARVWGDDLERTYL